MDRDTALRIDGILDAVSLNLISLTELIKKNTQDEELRKEMIFLVGKVMGEQKDITDKIYEFFPDIRR